MVYFTLTANLPRTAEELFPAGLSSDPWSQFLLFPFLWDDVRRGRVWLGVFFCFFLPQSRCLSAGVRAAGIGEGWSELRG